MEKSNKTKRSAPRPTKKGSERSQQDQIWKEILDAFLEVFMAFFFPAFHQRIDWKQGYEILDKEMVEITEEGGLGKQSADKLFKVKRRNGQEEYLLLHIEVQGYKDKRFAERVQMYNWLIRLKYKATVRSFAILTDPDPTFKPQGVHIEDNGYREIFEFPTIKLLEYWKNWRDLENSDNPFALVVMAHLQAQHLKGKPTELKEAKIRLIRLLFERGFERDYVLKLLKFIGWIALLPQQYEAEYRAEVAHIVTEEKMAIISNYDLVVQKEGNLKLLERQIEAQFGAVDPAVKERLKNLNNRQLENFGVALLKFKAVDDIAKWLDKHHA